MAEFLLLGPLAWVVGGRTVDLGTPKQRTVLAALLVDAGYPVSMETLIDRLWGESPPIEARNVLYAHITRIRRMLAQANPDDQPALHQLKRRAGGYVLDVDRDRVDLHRFRRLVDNARATGSHEQRRADALREALRLWRGPALADLSGAWATRVREGWRQRYLDTVGYWAQAELHLGNAALVVVPLTDVVADHPLAESLVGLLMRALYAVGRRADALECYARTRRHLVDQLGIDPGFELRQLHQQILQDDLG